jgi:hypothetical protein
MRERLKRLRWMIVPIAAYLVITLGLPAANGAMWRADFVRHATVVLGGCLAIVAIALVGGTIVELIRWTLWRKR